MEAIKPARNHGVTIAKAIAIICMVWGHSGCPPMVDHFLSMVRMPVFFIMSGYCFKDAYIDEGRKYLKKRVTGIYVPYIKWGLFFLLLHNLFCYIDFYNVEYGLTTDKDVPYTLTQMAVKVVQMAVLMVGNDKLLGGFWFLHDLFFGSVLFYASIKLLRKAKLLPVFLLVASVAVSYGLSLLNLGEKSQVVSRTFFAAFFISMGYAYKVGQWKFERSWIFICVVHALVFAVSLFWYSRFQDCSWKDMPLYAVIATLGTLSIYGLGQRLNEIEGKCRDFLVYVGGKTFNVLTWHMLSFKLVSALLILIYAQPWARMASFTVIGEYASKGWSWLYLFVGVMVPIAWSWVYDIIRKR